MALEATAQQMLLALTAHLHQHFGTAWMPDFNIMDYLQNVPWGTVVHETDESPKPTAVISAVAVLPPKGLRQGVDCDRALGCALGH